MLITEDVYIKMNSKHIKKYISLGYTCKVNDIINIKICDLSIGSKVLVKALCDYCNSYKELPYRDYIDNIKNSKLFSCSKKCSVIKRKETLLNTYGVEHQMYLDTIKSKIKKTLLNRYDVEHQMHLDSVKLKIQNTNISRYGVNCTLQLDSIKLKIKETNISRYGFEYPSMSIDIKNKTKKTIFERYNSNSYTSSEEYHLNTKIGSDVNYIRYIGDKVSEFRCDIGKMHTFKINSYNYLHRLNLNIPLCTICNPIGDQKSIKEKDLLEFIKDNYNGEIISGYRDVLKIDIYLPELKVGFEFNGLYWHSELFKDKNYHLNKTNHFKDKDIRIIHIWEDDWTFKQDIVKSQILNLLGRSKKIYARRCNIKEIKDSKDFLNVNHIQGQDRSSIRLGLYFGDNLVSLMTFDCFEGRNRMELGGYNLSRFCSLLGYNVIGGASKLLSYFIKKYNPSRIISYADKDWSIGHLYITLGFNIVSEGKPDYKYIINDKRIHKSRYRKSRTGLTESKLDLNKIWDSGKFKYEKIFIINI